MAKASCWLAFLAILAMAPLANAQNLYWDTNGTGTAGSGAATGTWGTSAFWTTDSTGLNVGSPVLTASTLSTNDLFFSAGTNGTTGTVTVSGTQLAHSISFGARTSGNIYTISGGTVNLGSATAGSGIFFGNFADVFNSAIILNNAASAIAINTSGNQTISFGSTATITGDATTGVTQTLSFGGFGSGAMTISGIISDGLGGGKVAVTVGAPGTNVTLAVANSYTGATNLAAGTLTISNASTFTSTSLINISTGRLIVNAANSSLAKLATGSGVVAGSFLRFSTAQTTAGTGNGPGTIFGTVELNLTNVNPNYTLDFGAGGALTNLVTATYTSPLTLTGTASIDSSTAVATLSTGGITASTSGAKTLNITGTNTGANLISSTIGNGSGTLSLIKGGGGNWILSGTNTYTGNTLVYSGTLQFTNQASLYNNGAATAWSNTNINVATGATLAFNVGGAGQFTKSDINTLLGLSNSTSNGFMSGSNVGLDTTGGSLLFDSVIANSNGGVNVLGLTKLGTNTLTLDQDNTFTGRTIISAGSLQLGGGGTTGKLSASSTILNSGTLTINRSNAVVQGTDFSSAPIVGTGAFIQAGAGSTTLNAANTYTGTTTVSAGVLTLTNALALQNSALVTTGAGTVTLGGPTILTLGGLSGATGNLASVISSGFTGTVTALTLNPQTGVSVTYGGVISDATTGMSLTKTGAGTQILSGSNSYTGDTIVTAGTLTVGSGANGSLDGSTALKVGGNGTFNYSRTGAGQTVNGLTVNAGSPSVNNTVTGQTLTLGGITRTAGVYGTVNFTTMTGPISTTFTNVNSIIGPWATTGSTTTLRYAVGSSSGSATNISAPAGTTATAADLGNVTDATLNYEYSAATTTASNLTANTLRYSGGATTTTIGASNTLTLNGFMNAGSAGPLVITGGPTTGGIIIGSTNELVIAANTQATTISAVIANGGAAGTLVYSGSGSNLTLSGANTYSGGLVINSGIVVTNVVPTLTSGGTGIGPITVNSAGRLTLGFGIGTLNRTITLNGGALFLAGSGNDITVAGTIALGANSTIDASNTNSGFPTISANISGTGGFTKTGLGGVRLNGTNSYTGPTIVSAGGVTVKSSLYGNDTTKWIPANITVANNSTLVLNVQGSGEFTLAQAATMFGQLSSNVNNNGLQAGAIIGVDTRNAASGTYTYSSVITDSTGAGGGSVSFKHTGTANTVLELTGANTYSGLSIVDNDAFLKVSSINSVFTNPDLGTVHSASSSLGAPTTVANGTIHLGTGGSTAQSSIGNTFRAGGLIYTGTGETTDRVLSLNDGGNVTSTLDQSGNGLLKFISPFSTTDNRGVKTILLQGSTTGTGELAGVIINANNNNNNLTKAGTGTWTLSGANLYTGVTTVNGGALVLANATALAGGIGSTGGLGALTFNGGVIGLGAGDFSRPLAAANTIGAATFSGAGGWAAYAADRLVNLGGASATITWATASTGFNGQTLILSNATATHKVTLQNGLDLTTGTRTVQVDNGSATVDAELSGVITGGTSGVLNKTGSGTLILSNTNNYTGGTTVIAGSLGIGNDSALGSGALNIGGTSSNTPTIFASGSSRSIANNVVLLATSVAGNPTIAGSEALTINGTTTASGAARILTVNNSAITTLAGNVFLSNDNTTSGRGLTINGTGNTLISGVIANNNAGNTLAATLTKGGSGILTLSNSNTYTGATQVNSGTLFVNGSHTGGAAYTVSGTGTLGGSGSIPAAVSIAANGTLAGGDPSIPGNNALTLTQGFSTVANSNIAVRLLTNIPDLSGTNPASNSFLNVMAGTTTIHGGTLFVLSGNPGLDGVSNYQYRIAAGVSTQAGLPITSPGQFNTTNLTGAGAYTFSVTQVGSDVFLNAAVPEPAMIGLVAAAAMGLIRLRRRATAL